RIAAEGWVDLTSALIQSWAKQSRRYDDASRPERAAIELLHPGVAVDQVLWRTLAAEPIASGAAAWSVLYRTMDRDRLIARLMGARADSPLHADLQAGWRDASVLPRNREQVLWLLHLRETEGGRLWRRVAEYVA